MAPLTKHNFARWLAAKPAAAFLAMGDGINADATAIHAAYPDIPYVAGYDTGVFAWSEADWNLFPKARHIHIVTQADLNQGDVLDVETGDASPDQAPGWIKLRKTSYYQPTIYCSRSVVNSVVTLCAAEGLKLNTDYALWVADWTGVPHATSSAAAVQYKSASFIDYSAVYNTAWPVRVAPPKPKPVVKYVRYLAVGGQSLDEIAALHKTTAANINEASLLKLREPNRAQFGNVLAGHLLKGMPYYVKEG